MKTYFQKNHEFSHTIEWHKEYMQENGLTELTVYPAVKVKDSGYFFCSAPEVYCVGEKNGTCGKFCPMYVPRNGIKGICTHSKSVYEPDFDKPKKLKISKTNSTHQMERREICFKITIARNVTNDTAVQYC